MSITHHYILVNEHGIFNVTIMVSDELVAVNIYGGCDIPSVWVSYSLSEPVTSYPFNESVLIYPFIFNADGVDINTVLDWIEKLFRKSKVLYEAVEKSVDTIKKYVELFATGSGDIW